jgi:endonuclease-8
VAQARGYTPEFYEWKQADADGTGRVWRGDTLSSHWLVHNKKTCTRCRIPLAKAHLGALDRRSFWCERCQKRYG